MRSWLQRIERSSLGRLAGDERGVALAIVGLAIIPLFAAIGLAVDVARGYMLKSKLSYAIDAAGLAGGRAFETDLREEDIMMFFDANFPPGYMNAVFEPGHPVITFNENENTVTIEATATIPTRFMSVAGVHTMTVSARTVIKRELRGMELVLVMDNTGSMRSGGKMTDMKNAATDLVNILYGDREEVPSFWVGVVPYAATVNIGSQHTDWLIQQAYDADAAWQNADPTSSTRFGYHPDHYAPTTWKGCVEARNYPRDSNDDAPDDEGWYPFLWRTTIDLFENDDWEPPTTDQDGDGDVDQDDWDEYYDMQDPSTWGPYLNGDNQWDPNGDESDLKLDNDLYQNNGTGPNLGCGPAVTPLVTEKSTVLAAIDDMAPWHRGGTMSNLGLAWGWRVLSPRWRGLWEESADPTTLPLDYTEPNMEKVVILLTDGNNEWYDWPGPSDTACKNGPPAHGGLPGTNNYRTSAQTGLCNTYKSAWPGADYTAYGRLNEGRLGTTSQSTANSLLDDRMLEMCTAMKASDIIIYTITFGGSPNAATQQLFRDCATDPDKYFHAPTGSTLQQAFVTIADELSNLRIAE